MALDGTTTGAEERKLTDVAKELLARWLAENLRDEGLILCWGAVILRVREDDQRRVLRLTREAELENVAAVTDLHTTDSVCFLPKIEARPEDVAEYLYQLAAAGHLACGRNAPR